MATITTSATNPNTWATYKDCSQAICSIYCPQWCYLNLQPPPSPPSFTEDGGDDSSTTDFSPLIIAVIGILISAFVLVSYYTIISNYCKRRNSDHEFNDATESDSLRNGLDESIINSITICKYKKGDGLIESTDCSVCLNEFEEDESLRLLPKCSHAFHLPCIDAWLKSNSTCPLCRANIVVHNNVSVGEFRQQLRNDIVLVIQESSTESVIEGIRRSVSLNSFQNRLSIADTILQASEDCCEDDFEIEKKKNGASVSIKRSFSFSFTKARNSVILPN